MSQYLSQIPIQSMRMEQRLTPQLIQSMDILQLPLAALEARINEELQSNPLLEDAGSPDAAGTPEPDHDGEEALPATRDPDAEAFERLEALAREYDFDPGDMPVGPRIYDGEPDPKIEAMANTPARPESLAEKLHEQWAFLDLDDQTRRAGEAIIDHLDEDGYLRTPLETVAESVYPPLTVDALERALPIVQSKLEPPGLAARDLQECLLLQLRALPGDHELEERIIREHLGDLEKNRLPAIARALGVSLEEVKQAAERISHLSPHPGYQLIEQTAPYITPDVIVEYDEGTGDYTVRLTRGNQPRLRISPYYRRLLQSRPKDKATREFLRRHWESARALLDAIKYRQERLLEVARAVVKHQRAFFDEGPSALRVLRMSDLAEQFGCDPSTISRTVADKYMQTPRGIYPLRYFFTGGTETADGEITSWDSVRARVQEIIEAEDKTNPLSDDQIADMLRKEGIHVSRRTIAKYRQILGIPNARQRREY